MSTSVLVGLAGVSIRITETRPLASRRLRGLADGRLVDAVEKPTAPMSKFANVLDSERLGPAIERLGMQDDVAGPGEGENRRGDRRHARRKQLQDSAPS